MASGRGDVAMIWFRRLKGAAGALFVRLVRSGADLHADPRVARRVVIGNTIALTLAAIALNYVRQFRGMGVPWPALYPILVASVISALSIWLNRQGHFTAARLALIIAANGAVLLFRIAIGMRGDPPFLYAVGCLPLILSDIRERRLLIFGVALSVGSAILIKLGAEWIMGPPILTDALAFKMQAITIVCTFVLLLSSVLHFVIANSRAEAKLSVANQKLEMSLAQLHEAQRRLVDISRRAGMAEVATSVLHNVGNVLNSVNVSAGLASETLRRSKVAGLGKAVAMMRERGDDLGAYLTCDPKGRRVPEYLETVSGAIADEHRTIVREMESLQKHIDHIRVVVSMQQAHARGTDGVVIEAVSLVELADEALATNLNLDDQASPIVEIARENDDIGPVATDRHRVLQILINLLSNARHAVRDGTGMGRIIVRVRRDDTSRCSIEIEDTGCGISKENLTRVFNYGFTTKKDGHGFGLHVSANLAAELGGSLTAHSDGPGKGALFTLQIPMRPAHAAGLAVAEGTGRAA